jgi:nicotinamidase-related amidase
MLIPERTAIVVIDLQHEFIGDGAIFPVPGGESLVADAKPFLREARSLGAQVIYTAFAVPDAEPVGRTTARLGVDQAHRLPGARLLDDLEIDGSDIVLWKSRQSAFVGTTLESTLRRRGVEHLVILGVTTHSCCLATAIDAAARDFDVVVVSDLTASPAVPARYGLPGMTAEQAHLAALQLIGYSSGRVVARSEILTELAREATA